MVFLRHIQALAGNIDSFITDIDISSKQNFTQLSAHIQKYESKTKQFKNIDSKILRISPLNEKEKELSDSLIRDDGSIEFMTKLKVLLKDMEFAQKPERNFHRELNPTSENENRKTKLQVKLPKLELKPFDRSVLNWQSFWDRFDSSVHKNTNLNDVDKFSYLLSFSCSSASESTSGLTMTADNYTEAIKLLHKRYGNTQVQISAHIKQFVSLPPVKSMNDVSGLRNLIDKLEGSVRNLKSLKVDPSSYGILLAPLINEKLPTEIRLLIV